MELTHKDIKDAVIRSQHCQRNWNLSKSIPDDDMDLLIHAVTNCPSKQNIAYYDVFVITDREIIERIHDETDGFITGPASTTTNSQVLANILFAFVPLYNDNLKVRLGEHRNTQLDSFKNNSTTEKDKAKLDRDRYTAIGIASGYLNLTASILGYSTGCCACFDPEKIKEIIGAENHVELLMGVGWKDETKNRRIHHKNNYIFPTKKKQIINVIKK
jgi:nitroreductase